MVSSNSEINESLEGLGFSSQRGAHNARTIMLAELRALLAFVNEANTPREHYLQAIVDDNCLAKRSGKSRELSARHLTTLYGLDPNLTIFRALVYYWQRDPEAQPLLALLCSYTRDSLLRLSGPFVLSKDEGAYITTQITEEFLEQKDFLSCSKSTICSIAKNLNSSWAQSGHLKGRVKKVRLPITPTPGATAFALLLGYLRGSRGDTLFETEYAKLLGCSKDQLIEMAEQASRKGWIVFKKVGDVIEVLFPNNLTSDEMELVREQG